MKRRLIATSCLLLLGALCVASVRRLEGPTATPNKLPQWFLSESTVVSPGIHVFLKPECGHCQVHLESLGKALHQLPPSIQEALRPRIHLWAFGESIHFVPGVRIIPMEPRSLGVQWTPTTWFVTASDSIGDIWRGARNASAWRGWLDRLQLTAAVVP